MASLFTLFKFGKTAHKTYKRHQHRKQHNQPFPQTLRSTPYHANPIQDNQRTGTMEKLQQHSHSGGAIAALIRISWRFLQFVMALTVIGLYGVDLDNARKAHVHADGKWLYAVILGGISCLITVFYLIPQIPSLKLALFVDWIAFILWLTLFGLFGKMYIGEKVEGDGGVQRMKNAVWVDLVNMLLWFISATYASLWNYYDRRRMAASRSEV